jgi:hypothetical protein
MAVAKISVDVEVDEMVLAHRPVIEVEDGEVLGDGDHRLVLIAAVTIMLQVLEDEGANVRKLSIDQLLDDGTKVREDGVGVT